MQDIRWKQRFNNFQRAFKILIDAVELGNARELSKLEQQGLIQCFEYTHELAWNVLKDYLEDKGIVGLIGSKDATREAFKNGLIEDGEVWMAMIVARNNTLHSYDPIIAQTVADDISGRFYPAFVHIAKKFTALNEQEEREMQEEFERRATQLENGEVEGIPYEVVKDKIHELLQR